MGQKKRIAGKKNRWKKSKISAALLTTVEKKCVIITPPHCHI